MSALVDLRSILGDPRSLGSDADSTWSDIEAELSTAVPRDARDFLNAYGGLVIEGFLAIHHPGAILDVHQELGAPITRNEWIPDPLLPAPGGMLLWGNTVMPTSSSWCSAPEVGTLPLDAANGSSGTRRASVCRSGSPTPSRQSRTSSGCPKGSSRCRSRSCSPAQ